MEIVFLGTGTSQGVPMIAYDDHDCDLTNPKNWRTRSSVHVVMDGVHIQVDAAPEFRMQCLWNKIPRVDHFILTHGHSDHMMGMDDLRRFCQILGDRAIPVYSQEIGLERVGHAFAYAMGDKPLHKGYPAFKLELMPSCLELPCGRIYSTVLPHGRFEVLGTVFEEKSSGKRFAYYTDCHEVTEEARGLAQNADVLGIDALRYHPHPSHLTVEQALEAIEAIKPHKAYFTHMTHFLDHEKLSGELPSGVAPAYDGLRIQI